MLSLISFSAVTHVTILMCMTAKCMSTRSDTGSNKQRRWVVVNVSLSTSRERKSLLVSRRGGKESKDLVKMQPG